MSVIGEAALSAFFQVLFSKFSSSLDFKFAGENQVLKEIEYWEQTLKSMHAVLADAEERQMKDQHLKIWLDDLKDLAYDVDDVLDEFATQVLGHKLMNNECQTSSIKVQKFVPTFCTGSNLHPSAIMFNKKMMSKIKHITKRLKQLETQKGNFQLTGARGPIKTVSNRLPSTSLVKEAEVYGRGRDKETMMNMVLTDYDIKDGTGVIPIVGMGGIGKTTLAQLVYNDSRVKDHFDIQAWVCVSQDFDIIKITKTILQSITHNPCDSNDLNLLQVNLKEKLWRKKFFIVLDDVWNESYDDWTKLRSPFDVGMSGSKIIITTRSSNVSSIVKTVSDFPLEKLSDDDSLCMLVHHAFGARDFSGHPDLTEFGLKIVKKCDGLPLATKTIGGLLRGTMDADAWKDILESEIWNLPEEKSAIIPALWLSYYHLSSQLKQCFAYCSLVHKGYEFTEQEIVLLWMAEGFLDEAKDKQHIEDMGSKHFKELVSRSFFQVSSKKKSHFVMHDLVNDLAQSVAGKMLFRMEGHEKMEFPRHVRHSSYIVGLFDGMTRFETFYSAKSLRTFLPFTHMLEQPCYLNNDVVFDLLPKLRYLRVLSLKRYRITKISYLIGNLKHLRYLDFSYTGIRSLPDSLCTLYNLETLLLRFCEQIQKLPSNIGNLINLYHLDITGSDLIRDMPQGIGKLTNLRALSNFIVGQDDGLNIREMQKLSNLKGKLSISELQNVKEAQYAWEAKLSSKYELDNLELKWTPNFDEDLRKKEVEKEVLTLLQPPKKLRVLSIKNYGGTTFPLWIEDPSFKNLQSLTLEDCKSCTLLPAVGKFPLLKHLRIKGMSRVVRVGHEFYGYTWSNAFPSLETLHFEDMPEWKEWNPFGGNEKGTSFHSLRELFIKNCPKLVRTLPSCLPCLEKLVINECQQLVVPISNFPMLGELEIDGCNELVLRSSIDLWSVKKVSLLNISKFSSATREMAMINSINVEKLHTNVSQELASLWKTKWEWLAPLTSLHHLKLQNFRQVVSIAAATKVEEKEELLQLQMPCNIEHVRIEDCEGFRNLSKTMNNLMCLAELEIIKCPKLVFIPIENLPLTLKSLVIGNCENLQCLLEDGEKKSCSTMALESLEVSKCEALKLLSSSGTLPVRLERLDIHGCPKLEFVAHEIGENSSLKSIYLRYCKNITYLPEGMDKLCHLQSINIHSCPNLVCFPESGMPANSLKHMWIIGCEKLQALPKLYSLQRLCISNCPRVKSIENGDLAVNLQSLTIYEPDLSKAVMEWGLHKLNCLTQLEIDGSNIDVVSFPGENMRWLPPSLHHLYIYNFKNLRKLSSNGFRNLSSLRSLWIYNCIKLKSLPRKDVLPSLCILFIWYCPLLKESCTRLRGKQWSNIAHIPRVEIDGISVHE